MSEFIDFMCYCLLMDACEDDYERRRRYIRNQTYIPERESFQTQNQPKKYMFMGPHGQLTIIREEEVNKKEE